MRKNLSIPAAAAVLALAAAAASAESTFTIVALPDTQFYSSTYPATFTAQTNWIKNNASAQNIVFVTHEGDIINTNGNASEWTNATNAMNVLDTTSVHYATCPGNHDTDGGTSYTNYAANFGATRYSGKPGFLATTATKNNCLAMTFTAGSRQFLSLSLDAFDGANSIAFAQSQINLHPGMPTIVTLHSYYNAVTGSWTGEGQQFWDSLIKINDQVFMVLCGHMHGVYHDSDLNNYNHPVYEMLADYQSDDNGGNGYMRLIQFDPDSSAIHVTSYSPTLLSYRTDGVGALANQFDYTGVDFSRLPEPATLALLAFGGAGISLLRRRRRAA